MTCVGYFDRGTQEASEHHRRAWSDLHRLLQPGGPVMLMGPELMNFDALKSNVQSPIDQKCTKTYPVPTTLVVCAVMGHVPLTPAEEGPGIARQITITDNSAFERT